MRASDSDLRARKSERSGNDVAPFLAIEKYNTMREMLAHPEPVDISLFTSKGEVQHYKNCISLRYDFRTGTRRIKLLSSGQIRQVRDVCIFQINGMEVFL